MSRRAKIAATLGPACDDPATLRALLDAGVDVARLNFSHGTAADHRRRARALRRAAKQAGRTVALLADLQGPRFRVGELPAGGLELVEGESVTLLAGAARAARGEIPVSYAALARDVRRGQPVLLDDGTIGLRVERVRGERVRCTVERGGTLTDHKGINLPESDLSVPALTRKDRDDLATAVDIGADWLAISFVRRGADVRLARGLLRRAGAASTPVMAKIERAEALDGLDDILAESDGILVARGDLGVELAPERVPMLQKRIIEAGRNAGLPVMTATQMLESMRHSRRPTRAEATDVANAVLDGSSCLLLTAETAVGDHPLDAVRMMDRIVCEAEAADRTWLPPEGRGPLSISEATCLAGCGAVRRSGAAALVVFTQSGFSARQVARYRPPAPILAFTPVPAVANRLAVSWGVEARTVKTRRTIEEVMRALDRALLDQGLAAKGDVVVVLSGSPIGVSGTTNLMTVHRVGSASRRWSAGTHRSGT